ncbi:MAG: M14 family zinc carboxypeptidase [Acidobacteriota bacterium]
MSTRTRFLAGMVGAVLAAAAWAVTLPAPAAHFGFRPGADGQLLDYEQILGYLKALDAASPRVELREVGASPLGKPMVVAFVSAAENIARLDELREINRRLALDPAIPDSERAQLVARGRVFVLATLSMHAEELAPCQAFPLYAYELAASEDPEVLRQLRDVVMMVVPAHNPDGLDMVVANYRKYKGTPWDGASLPGVYHRYVGHDNNRDFVTLTQEDNRAVSRLFSTDWFPQAMVEKHGMGSAGPRYFCPPSHDPIAENIEAGVWTWIAVFGTNMTHDMARDGLKGVAQHWAFDDYWPGSTETAIWKNVVGLLTENATPNGASPVFIEPTELNADDKGLGEYKKSVNMLDPWPGGWWSLGDAVTYELSSFRSLLHTGSASRAELLRFRNDLCRREVRRGQSQPPYYFVLPSGQRDRGEWAALVNLLLEHGVKVFTVPKRITAGGRRFEPGSVVVPLAQPYRPFIKEVLEAQRYPVRHFTPGGPMIEPYDITSWSLPLHRGVAAEQVDVRLPELEVALQPVEGAFRVVDRAAELPAGAWGVAFSANENEAFHAAFLALRDGLPVSRATAATTAGGAVLPAGSFVIRSGADPATLPKLLRAVAVPPVVLTVAPAAALQPLKAPRIALVETSFHDMDAGWTRYLFDTYSIPFRIVHPGEIEKLDLTASFDLVVFPSTEKELLLKGRYVHEEEAYLPDLPPEFRKGIGSKGMEKLMAFADAGGIIVAWGRSCGLFLGVQEIKRGEGEVEEFQLPVKDVSDELGKKGLLVPGSWLRVNVLQDHPLTWGMPAEAGVFSRGRPVFRTSQPGLDTDRRVLLSHPEEEILVSGYVGDEKLLGNTVAAVWTRKGKGQFVLYGFSPQFRASTQANFKLLFNALLLPRL